MSGLRMRQICLVARSLAPVVDEIRSVLALEVCHRDPGVGKFGLENALFPVGDGYLEVVAPVRDGTTAGRYLERRGGDGGYMVITQCDDLAARRTRCEAVGVRIANEIGYQEYRELQLHPRVGTAAAGEQDARGEDEHADRPYEVSKGAPHRALHAATFLPPL